MHTQSVSKNEWNDMLAQVAKQGTESTAFSRLFREVDGLLKAKLAAKGINLDDMEDVLQDFYSKAFLNAIQSFDPTYNIKFSTYILNIFLRRLIRYRKNQLTEQSQLCLFSDAETDNDTNDLIETLSKEYDHLGDWVRDEIRSFFQEGIRELPDERMQQIMLLRFSMPYKVTAEESADILDISVGLYNRKLYQSIHALKVWVDKKREAMQFSYDDLLQFFKKEGLQLDWNLFKKHPDPAMYPLTHALFQEKKSISELCQEFDKDQNWVFRKIREGFQWVLSHSKMFTRTGGTIMSHSSPPNQDKVLQFLNELDQTYASGTQQGFTTRSVGASTGDAEWDDFLTVLHLSLNETQSQVSFRDYVLETLDHHHLTLDGFAQHFQLTDEEMIALASDQVDDALQERIQKYVTSLSSL